MSIKDIYQKANLHLQIEPYACGPASLLNVLRLKGDNRYNEADLIKLCNARPKIGTDNPDLVSAAGQVGLEVVEVAENASPKDIERQLDGGSWVIVNYYYAFTGGGHYAVIIEHDDQAFYFLDSDLGLLRLKKDEFAPNWHSKDGSVRGWFLAVC